MIRVVEFMIGVFVKLKEAFNLKDKGYTYIIGGGGKTTLMFALAEELIKEGLKVITSTTTKIGVSEAKGVLNINELEQGEFFHVTIGQEIDGTKLIGLEPKKLDLLREYADHVIVEADGSKRKLLKAHAFYEPVVSSVAGLVIVVIGVDIIGRPLCEENIHRSILFGDIYNIELGTLITEEHIVGVLTHSKGYLREIPLSTPIMVLLTHSRSERDDVLALAIGKACPRVLRVISCRCKDDHEAVVLWDRLEA